MMEFWIRTFITIIGDIAEGLAGLILGLAVLSVFWKFLTGLFKNSAPDRLELKLTMGKSLALALEFLLAADIIKTAVTPGWNEIGQLAAIAALRTFLNYFLEKELINGHKLKS